MRLPSSRFDSTLILFVHALPHVLLETIEEGAAAKRLVLGIAGKFGCLFELTMQHPFHLEGLEDVTARAHFVFDAVWLVHATLILAE